MEQTTHLNTKDARYSVVFTPDPEGGYVVTFPEIPHLATQGETLREARRMAQECLEGYLEVLMTQGCALPIAPRGRRRPLLEDILVTPRAA
jgi:antitoxin HicB